MLTAHQCFFFLVYLHIGRGLYYSSFNFKLVWISGVFILLLLIATSFLGYVLPWGQISFWGATVITNLLSAIPFLGTEITYWLWGGFSVDKSTLTRFFSLHFILPFIILFIIIIHIFFLHEKGSSNPLGLTLNIDKIPFHPYFSWKDILGLIILIIIFFSLILLDPFYLNDPENFIPANPLVTPPHIQPEWYFLFAYAILRRIPNKLGGVIALFLAILILAFLPFSSKNKFNPIFFYPSIKILFWSIVNIFLILTYIGACPVEDPFIIFGQIFSILYFSFFILFPIIIK